MTRGAFELSSEPLLVAMKLPRWTVYPAMATLAVLAMTAVPRRGSNFHSEGAAQRTREAAIENRDGERLEGQDEQLEALPEHPTSGAESDKS